jgi:hypothetical protein
MSEGFYERLGVGETANLEEIKAAYQRKLAELVRRLRGARRRGADVSILESRERALREAVEILQDSNRRRRYDAFIQANREGLPEDAQELWAQHRGSMVDPVAAAALSSVQALTTLPLGDPLPELSIDVEKSTVQAAAWTPEKPQAEADAQVVRFSEEVPTVIDEIRPVAVDVPVENESASSVSTLDMPLPAARTDLFDESSAKAVPSVTVQVEVPEAAQSAAVLDGRFLAQVREQRGMSLDELAGTTRISTRYLEAIEENAFEKLPAAPFVRGYVRQVAQILGVEDQGVVEGFMDMYNHHRG